MAASEVAPQPARVLIVDDSRIVRAAKHRVTEEPVRRHAEFREARANRGFKGAFGVVEREFKFA